MKLPPADEPVLLVLDVPERRVPSRVEEFRGADTLGVVAPFEDGVEIPVATGDRLALEWTSARGLVRTEGVVVERSEQRVPYLYVRAESTRIVQRRDNVRVEIVLDVEIRQTASVPVACNTLELSGSGMRALVPLDLRPREPVEATLSLPDEPPIELEAEVIRGSEEHGYAFRFVSFEPDEHERLIRFVFGAHRRGFVRVRRSA
jgi:c-di-GMP-binding flagellar brake protein YcgR